MWRRAIPSNKDDNTNGQIPYHALKSSIFKNYKSEVTQEFHKPAVLISAFGFFAVLLAWMLMEFFMQGQLQHLFPSVIPYVHIPSSLILSMLIFVIVLVIASWILKKVYRKPAFELIKGKANNVFNYCFGGFGIWFVCMLALTLVLKNIHKTNWHFTYSFPHWWLAAAFWTLTLPAQTLFEELMFRFWLPKLFTFSTPQGAHVISALVFAVLHSGNSEFTVYPWYWIAMYYFGFGLFFSMLKLKSGSVLLPWSVHFAHNLSVVLWVQYPHASIQTPALWTSQIDESLSVSLISSAILMGLAYIPFKKLYFK